MIGLIKGDTGSLDIAHMESQKERDGNVISFDVWSVRLRVEFEGLRVQRVFFSGLGLGIG